MANNDQSNNSDNRRRNSSPDAQGHWYSNLSSPSLPSLVMNMTPTMFIMEISPPVQPTAATTDHQAPEQVIAVATAVPTRLETICISSGDDDNGDKNGIHHQPVAQITSVLPVEEWRPVAASTPQEEEPMPMIGIIPTERQSEQELFDNIQRLVQEFVSRPNRHYPYYRVMRLTTGDQPRIEHLVTVVINRPTILLYDKKKTL